MTHEYRPVQKLPYIDLPELRIELNCKYLLYTSILYNVISVQTDTQKDSHAEKALHYFFNEKYSSSNSIVMDLTKHFQKYWKIDSKRHVNLSAHLT